MPKLPRIKKVKKVKAWAVLRGGELGQTLCNNWIVRGTTYSIFEKKKSANWHKDSSGKVIPVTITYHI